MIWIVFFILGLLGAYLVVDKWVVRRGAIKKVYEEVSPLIIGLSFLLKTISIGALMGLFGYGIGVGLSHFLGSDWTFAGIVSLRVGLGVWAGVCGLVIGFSFAFRQYIRSIKQNSE